MFRGRATLMQANPRGKRVFAAGLVATALVIAVIGVLPGKTKVIGAVVIVTAFAAIYMRALSGALVPQRTPVELYVDHDGIYADNAPVAMRADIENAYIRPALAARTSRHSNVGGFTPTSYRLNLPSYPLTVELVVRRGGQINIDPGGPGPASEILIALGFAVTTCAPDYVARTGSQRRSSVLVLVVFAAMFVGYYIFMSTRH
jgi:hypothetical protein